VSGDQYYLTVKIRELVIAGDYLT